MTIAESIYNRFRAKPGSERMANAFALEGLAYWLERQRPKRVLEVGAGIGTCSEVIRQWMMGNFAALVGAEVVCVEDDPWCQAQWRKNLGFLPPGMRLEERVPIHEFWEFVILDGPQLRPEEWAILSPQATVFIEGGRRPQCQALRACLAGTPYTGASWRPRDRTKGYSVIRRNPTQAERLRFLAVRIREWGLDLPRRAGRLPIGKRRL